MRVVKERMGLGLVNYKLRSNYAEVQVFIQKEKGVYRNITKHNQTKYSNQFVSQNKLRVLRFFLFCLVYLCLFIIFRSESWCCHFDSLLFDS